MDEILLFFFQQIMNLKMRSSHTPSLRFNMNFSSMIAVPIEC